MTETTISTIYICQKQTAINEHSIRTNATTDIFRSIRHFLPKLYDNCINRFQHQSVHDALLNSKQLVSRVAVLYQVLNKKVPVPVVQVPVQVPVHSLQATV